MNRLIIVFILGLVFIISGCKEQSFDPPLHDDPIAVISHLKEQTLTFIDLEENSMLSSVDSRYPLTEIIKIDDSHIIATSQSASSLILFDLIKGKSKPFLEMNQGLKALNYDASTQLLYVSDTMNNQVHTIDMKKKEIIHSMSVSSYPTELVRDHNKLFVLSGDDSEVTVIDLKKQKVLHTFSVLERPSGMYFDGTKLWIGGHGSLGQLNSHIYSYNPDTYEQIDDIQVGLMPVAFFGGVESPYLYVLCHGDHALVKLDKETSKVISSIDVGQNPNYITGDEKNLFVTNLDGDSVSIIDKELFELTAELPVPAGPYAIILEE